MANKGTKQEERRGKSQGEEEKRQDANPGFFRWEIPGQVDVDPDPLVLQINFYHHSVVLRSYEESGVVTTRPVSAREITHTLATELTFSTGLLPENTLWWNNTKRGNSTAIYVPPKTRIITLQENLDETARRFNLPIPGLVFVCSPGHAPAVYAVKRKPSHTTDIVYNAPFTNIYREGSSCPGNHKYPQEIGKIPDNFFLSFFTTAGDVANRSQKFPKNILHLWADLDGKKAYPLNDLVKFGSIKDLLDERL